MDDETLRTILEKYRVVAVVGCSRDPRKDAHTVPKYLQENGYRVIPVNPFAEELLGERAYPNLKEIPERIEIVNIFRPSEEVERVVDDALATEAKVIWMQLGIENARAAEKAEKAGLQVVMNRCIMIEHSRLLGVGRIASL